MTLYPGHERGISIRFRLEEIKIVEISIYSIQGKVINRLINRSLYSGEPIVDWDRRDGKGVRVSPGQYILHITVDGIRLTKRVLVF